MKETTIPFGASDSELMEATYFIPQGYHAVIEGDKVIIRKGDTEKEGIKTKFKVGDTIRNKQWPTACHTIESIDSESYYLDNGGKVEIAHQDLWELEQPIKRTPAEIEAAMQEIEEKSKLFTKAHKDDVVSNDTLKVKYANRIYDVVDCEKLPGEIIYYVIEDEIGHIDYINPDNCEVIEEPVSENTQFAQMADKYEQQVLIGEYQMKESVAHHCRLSYYLGLKDGAQWQKEKIIAKACEWLEENKEHPFIGCEDPFFSGYLTDEFIEDFKKAMEE